MREVEVDVVCSCSIMRTLILCVLMPGKTLGTNAKLVREEAPREGAPRFICLLLHLRPNEILHFHLLKLSDAEDKVAWRDLVTKRFTNLGDAKWQLRMH